MKLDRRHGNPGRPRLTDAAAWISLRTRFYRHIKEVKGSECQVYTGPRSLEIAGERGSIGFLNFALIEMGCDLRVKGLSYRTCETTRCVWPDHLIITDLREPREMPSWVPDPIPPG